MENYKGSQKCRGYYVMSTHVLIVQIQQLLILNQVFLIYTLSVPHPSKLQSC